MIKMERFLLLAFSFFITMAHAEPIKTMCVVYEFQEPYQYVLTKEGISFYQGLDIEILQQSLGKDINVKFKHLDWDDGLDALEDGECDVVLGAYKSAAREKYAYFSTSYRSSADKLYINKGASFKFDTIDEFLASERLKTFRIGVIKNSRYTSDSLNNYLKSPKYPQNVVRADSDKQLVKLLVDKQIDGYFADNTAMELFLWRSGLHEKISESSMDVGRVPVYFMLSKKSVPLKLVKEINTRISNLKASEKYNRLLRTYRVPLFIAMTTDTLYYHLLEILGTIFYAISGLVLAREANFSFTGAFILAMLPGIGGGLMRDVLLDRVPATVFRTPVYFLTVVFTTVAFYIFIRLRYYFDPIQKMSDFFKEVFHPERFEVVRATDAIGLAVFTIIGVMVTVEMQATPLWLWGPVISVLSSTGGGIVRDFFMGRELNRTFFYETSFIWSLGLTSFIIFKTGTISSQEIFYAIIITFVGIITTRILFLKSRVTTSDFWLERDDKEAK